MEKILSINQEISLSLAQDSFEPDSIPRNFLEELLSTIQKKHLQITLFLAAGARAP
jgi:hypothetical protein